MPIRALVVVGFGLAAALCSGDASRAQPAAAIAPATEQDVARSREAIWTLDAERLIADPAYAAEILQHLDRLRGDRADDPDLASAYDVLRVIALVTTGRLDEVRSTTERVLARRPREADEYAAPISAALALQDHELLVMAIETASRNVPGIARGELRTLLEREFLFPTFQELAIADRDDLRVRLATALFRVGWPGDGDIETPDSLRLILLEDRLRQGDRTAAADLAAALTSPANVLPLLAMREYDSLFASDADRLATLRSALARYDRQTAENMAGDSAALPFVLERSRYLRAVGRDSEALDLLLPHTRDVAATVAAHHYGMWIVNQAVYTLLALDRDDEAVTLMERLVALPIAENATLIGPYINHIVVLAAADRHEEALAYARQVERDHGRFANDHGRSVIAARMICELAELGRAAEAAPLVERIRSGGETMLPNLMNAYICLGDMDAAEAVAIRRLEGDEAESLVMSFQDFAIRPERPEPDSIRERHLSLRERPAVRAAFDRVGRLMSLPLASAAWSGL